VQMRRRRELEGGVKHVNRNPLDPSITLSQRLPHRKINAIRVGFQTCDAKCCNKDGVLAESSRRLATF
jgi:hypothetical protein